MSDSIESSGGDDFNETTGFKRHLPNKRISNVKRVKVSLSTTTKGFDKCDHPVMFKGMCGKCGKSLYEKFEDNKIQEQGVNMQFDQIVRVSREYNEEINKCDIELLLKKRKLVLLLDLDETLLHSCNRPPLREEFSVDLIRFQIGPNWYYTKLRPETLEFLRICQELFEMHVVSYGQRIYTHTLTQVIDPFTSIFDDRVLSRDELKSSMHKSKNFSDLFPLGDHFIIMIDDRADVWEYSDAHIMIRPFKYFKNVEDINSPNLRNNEVSKVIPKLVIESNAEVIDKIEPKKELLEECYQEKIMFNDSKTNDKTAILSGEDADISNKDAVINGKETMHLIEERKIMDNDDSERKELTSADPIESAVGPSIEKLISDEASTSDITIAVTSASSSTVTAVTSYGMYGYDIEKITFISLAKSGTPGVSRTKNEFRKVIPSGNDPTLPRMAEILRMIHTEFYRAYDETINKGVPFNLDVKDVMANMKKEVLKDEYIVLSGICELGKDPRGHWLFWELERFGAVGQTEVNELTTVVVAAANNTEKVNDAKSRSIPVVTAVWLLECIYDWKKHDKEKFVFEKSPSVPPHVLMYGNREPNVNVEDNE